MLARIPADVSKRLFTTLCAVALLTAACSEIPEGEVVAGEGTRSSRPSPTSSTTWASATPSPSTPTACPTTPTRSSRPSSPKARSPPPVRSAPRTSRPSPPRTSRSDFGAAVGVGERQRRRHLAREAPPRRFATLPSGITVPYGPATVDQLVGATPENTNGTDIAIDEQRRQARRLDRARRHLVRRRRRHVHRRRRSSTTASPIRRAGPIGRPAVTADADGNAWVAYTVHAHRPAGRGRDADRTPGGTTQTVADIPLVRRMPSAPAAREIGVTGAGPTVAYVDTVEERGDGGPLDGDRWTSTVVAPGVSGDGLDMAVDADGVRPLTFYDGQGGVKLATPGRRWDGP